MEPVWAGVFHPLPGMGMRGRRLRRHSHPGRSRLPWAAPRGLSPHEAAETLVLERLPEQVPDLGVTSRPRAVPAPWGPRVMLCALEKGRADGKGDRAFL